MSRKVKGHELAIKNFASSPYPQAFQTNSPMKIKRGGNIIFSGVEDVSGPSKSKAISPKVYGIEHEARGQLRFSHPCASKNSPPSK
jgi:hypothetical protein